MQIKRFEAKSMTAALRLIKDELGPDAVILSARSLRKDRGFFGSMKHAGVEVTAAIDKQLPSIKYTNTVGAQSPHPNLGKTRSVWRNQAVKRENISPDTNVPTSKRRKKTDSDRNNKVLSSMYQQLLAQEIDRGIAAELIDEIKRIPASQKLVAKDELKLHLASIIEEMGVTVEEHVFTEESKNVMAVLGTTGVGKTTVIAKLAALHATRWGKKVALISLDNYGIAAIEQLKAYAQIINIPLKTAVNVDELKRAVVGFKDKELIFIDTPGLSPTNQSRIHELKTNFAEIPNLQTHLVLSATTKEKDLIATAQAFEKVGVHRLLFTKVDEGSIFGTMINVLIGTNVPLSYLCRGRKVPDDIESGSIKKLIDLLFQSESLDGRQSAKSPNLRNLQGNSLHDRTIHQPYFVANKNSEVYHCSHCKWAKKIKTDNIIQFISTQEAEAQNFLPCRSCNPDRYQRDNHIGSKTEKMMLSRYR